jgi:putative ABC transport system permease protein
LTTALGIGATSSVFSVANAVLLRPLPYAQADRLVAVSQGLPASNMGDAPTSPANFLDWQRRSHVFAGLAAYARTPFNLTGSEQPERVMGARVSRNLFALLGIRPVLGPGITVESRDDLTVVLGSGLWQRRFGSDRKVLGRTLTMDGKSYLIVGVMPPEMQLVPGAELYVPLVFSANELLQRGAIFLDAVARLKPGVTLQLAQEEMSAVARTLEQDYPDPNTGWTVRVVSLYERTLGSVRTPLLVLLGAVGLVLMVSCANVANLLLARAGERRREIAIRAALGASRAHLLRHSLAEGLVLGGLGGAIGLLLTQWGIRLLIGLKPAGVPRIETVSIDWRVLLFTVAVSLLTGLVFGVVPAMQGASAGLVGTLKSGGVQTSAVRTQSRLRSGLVVAEVALALVLLIGAGLLIGSFQRLRAVDPGFDPQQALTCQLVLAESAYPGIPPKVLFFQQLLERLRALPGVQAAGAVTTLPLSGAVVKEIMAIPGRHLTPEQEAVNLDVATPDYFRAMGIRLLKGRFFNTQDRAGSEPVAILDEAMARVYWPGEEAVGQKLVLPSLLPQSMRVVGVVASVRHEGLDRQPQPRLYIPLAAYAEKRMDVVVRTSLRPAALTAAVRGAVAAENRNQPVSNLRPLSDIMAASISQQRFNTWQMEVFAALALVLALVGIYGVLAYVVTQRTREIGIRMALGGSKSEVMKLILAKGMTLAGSGLALGLLLALGLTRLLENLLYGLRATDPFTFIFFSLVLGLMALVACYLPARRATSVDPMIALRHD